MIDLVQTSKDDAANKTIVVYHYFERDASYLDNLQFFLDFGIVSNVDYVFLVAGGCSAELPIAPNIQVFYTENLGSDFATYAHVISSSFLEQYKFFIFLNCTMIGPFQLRDCDVEWPRLLTDLLVGDVKLVGATINVLPENAGMAGVYAKRHGGKAPFPHVQTMLFAADNDCLTFLSQSGFFASFSGGDRNEVIANSEIRLSSLVLERGWQISCLMPEYQNVDYRVLQNEINPNAREGDPWFENAYFGRSLHPYETLFHKTNRNVRPSSEIDSLVASRRRLRQTLRKTKTDDVLASIISAWKGHKNFARWIVQETSAKCVVDLGVDFGFSTICFAEAGTADVYGIDSFEGDEQAGLRDTYELASANLKNLGLSNAHLIKGYFSDVAQTWSKQVDILHIDGLHDYPSVLRDFESWKDFVCPSGVFLFHDTCVSHFGVRKFFDEIELPKINFRHSFGLGVASRDRGLIDKIKATFGQLLEY